MAEYIIKILTLNIHKGKSLTKLKETVNEIKENLIEVGANIICLQEVVGAHLALAKKSQFEYLAEGNWSHYAYGKNASHKRDHHGNAILSKTPFLQSANFNISNHRFEKRGILYGVISSPGLIDHDVHVMTGHFDLTTWGRRRQIKKLCDLIERYVPPSVPLIVCGDFNDWRERMSSYIYKRVGLQEAYLNQEGSHAKTFPTFMPFLKLDRIYFRNVHIQKIVRLDSPVWHKLSDHLGLYAEFTL